MREPTAPSRRRRRTKSFGPSTAARSKISPATWAILGLMPALLYLGHLAFGANQTVAALWFTALCALVLIGALAVPQGRIGLFDLRPLAPLLLLFGCVLAVAVWSLTPWVPGGPHPIWAWSGAARGASTVDISATTVEIIKLLGLACVFLIGCLQAARQDRARTTFDLLIYLGAAYATISLLTFLAGSQVLRGGRLSGGFLSPNSGATVFGVLVVLGVAGLARAWRQAAGLGVTAMVSRASVPAACLLLFATCLLLTASRMGLAATGIACGVLLAWELVETRGRRLPILIGAVLLLLAGMVLLVGGNDLVWRRIDNLDQDLVVRSAIFSAHWRAFLDSPLLGYGLGSFERVNHLIMTAETYGDLWAIRAAHNVYLQWLEEAGIIGAAPMFLLIGFIIAVAIWRTGQMRSAQGIMRGLVVANLVILIHGATDFGLQVPSIAAFWALLLGVQYGFGTGRG